MAYLLNRAERDSARSIVIEAARKGLAHAPEIHYTQGVHRWDGFNDHLRVVKGQFPHYADCSSYVSWILYNAISHAKHDLHIPDVVNGENWGGGYTGTLKDHGKRVYGALIVGDEVHYGPGSGSHVAIYIGGGFVFSHGSEGGPYKLPVHYRSDFAEARRVIRAV